MGEGGKTNLNNQQWREPMTDEQAALERATGFAAKDASSCRATKICAPATAIHSRLRTSRASASTNSRSSISTG